MIKKNFWVVIISILTCASLVLVIGCSENPASSKNATNESSQPNVLADSLNPEVQSSFTESERMNQWIAAMDPFVTENADGTFSFDNEGFSQVNSAMLTDDDLTTVSGLREGISVVNQKIQEVNQNPAAYKIWFRWYWWGYKECYSQYSAVVMINFLAKSNWGYGLWYWANYHNYHSGYFCIAHSWTGYLWITR